MATSEPFGVNPFTTAPAAAPVLPQLQPMVEVRVGDDWPFQFNITDPTGRPIDLTGMVVNNPIGGATVGAELFGTLVANPAVISGVNGSLQIVDAVNGVVSGVVSRSLTALVPPQSVKATNSPVRLSIFVIDTLWRKHTFPPIVLLPLRPSDVAAVPTQPQQITLTLGVQGPAGASSSLTATQIAVLDAATLASAETYTDQQIAAIPDTTPVTQQLIRQALVAYATKNDVQTATAGFATNDEVSAAIQAFFDQQTFAPTGAALNALIDARVVNYLQQTASLIGNAQAIASATATLQLSQVLVGAAQSGAAIGGALLKTLTLGGSVNGAATVAGGLSISTPLAGAVNATASVAGMVIAQAPGANTLAGQVSAVAAVTGSLSQSIALAGATNAQAQPQGALTMAVSLSGAVSAPATATGQLTRANLLGGAVSALAVAAGSLGYNNYLGGQTNASATPLGLLSRDLTLAAQIAAPASATGSLSTANTSPLFFAGFLGSSSAPSGTTIYSGNTSSMPVITGNLSRAKILTGAVLAQATATGAMTTAANGNRSPIFAFGLLGAGY